MKNKTLMKFGIVIGVLPMIFTIISFLILWVCRSFFAIDDKTEGFQFVVIYFTMPIYLVSGICLLTSFLTNLKTKKYKYSIFVFLIILLSVPIMLFAMRKEGEISSRAYLKIQNETKRDFENISIQEPDNLSMFGSLNSNSTKIIYYEPDYASNNGIEYAGISENYLIIIINNQTINLKLPNIQPGEIHKLTIDKEFNIVDEHINKPTFKQ